MPHPRNWTTSLRTNRMAALFAGAAIALGASALIVNRRVSRAERAHLPKGKFITVDGVRLHYIDKGNGPTVVFLHGNGAMMDDMIISGIVDATANYRTIVFDRPGFGFSERPRNRSWSPAEQAALFAKAFSFLGLNEPIVFGHSWGTLVALAMALNHPQSVSGLVLASGYYFPTPRKDLLLMSGPSIPIVGDVISYTVAPFVGDVVGWPLISKMFSPQPIPPRFRREFPMELTLRPSQIKSFSQEQTHMISAAQQLNTRYSTIACPTVIMAGDADRIVDHEKQAQRLHASIPGSRLSILPGAGHMIHHLDPARMVEAIDLIANGEISTESMRTEAASWGTANGEGERSARAPLESDRTIVPPDAVGWMVRVTTPPATEEFWLAAYPDKDDAEAAVKEHVKASAAEALEGVATLSSDELAAQHMNPGDIKHG
jgi:pimeloyl-ACP methyl ester carboxylesterase